MPSPYNPDDAEQVLADFGEDLVCVAVPSVTRGLVDDVVGEQRFEDGTSTSQLTVLKVKRGAFGTTKVVDTRVTVVSRNTAYKIDKPLPHGASLFDWYALQKALTRPPL